MRKRQPFFTIIVPTLNEQRYLPKLLASLAAQTYRSFEVILIDGKSEDLTVQQAKRWETKFPLTILTSTRRNPSFQRNMGAKRGRGKYFVFFDADVTIPPEYMEGIHYMIITRRYPFVTTWLEGDSQTSADKLVITSYNLSMELLTAIGKQFSPGFNTIVHRDIFSQVGGFNEKITLADDHDFSVRVGKLGYGLVILKEPKLTMSLRRYRSAGTLETIRIYTQACMSVLLNGPMPKGYLMGGHVHKQKKKPKTSSEIVKSYLTKFEDLEKKFARLLAE